MVSSCGHTVALTSEQVNTMSGTELILPFVALKKNSQSLFSQSQTNVNLADVTDKRQREREQQRESKQEQEFRIQHCNVIPTANKDTAGVRTREEKERDSELGGVRKKVN